MNDSTIGGATNTATKLCPPSFRLQTHVSRERLNARLSKELSSARVVLVQAAAGYGKSQSVACALELLPASFAKAWISLDEGDSFVALVRAVAQAVEPYDPPWTSDPIAWISSVVPGDKGSLIAGADAFLRTLQSIDASHCVLVLDDVHRLTHEPAQAFIEYLAERLGDHWTVVLISRIRPNFHLARMAASGQVALVREPELALSHEETLSLCSELPVQLAELVWRRTSGWPAGVQLALASSSCAGGTSLEEMIDESVFDFLISEIVDQLPQDLRIFLLQLACLDDFGPEDAERFTGRSDARRLLEEARKRSLFITDVGHGTQAVRFHDLFREALLRRLQLEPGLDVAELMRRAAARAETPAKKVSLLFKAGEWAEAAKELAHAAPTYLLKGEVDELESLLRMFKGPKGEPLPDVLATEGLIALSRWDWAAGATLMKRAAASYSSCDRAADALEARCLVPIALAGLGDNRAAQSLLKVLEHESGLTNQARVRIGVAQCWVLISEGKLAETGLQVARTLDLLSAMDAPPQLWQQAQPLPAYVGLPGTKEALSRWVHGALRRSGELPTTLRGMAQVLRGWLLLRAGNRQAAWEACEEAADECRWLHQPKALSFQLGLLRAQLLAIDSRQGELESHLDAILGPSPATPELVRSSAERGLTLYLGCRFANQAGHTSLAVRLATQLLGEPDASAGWVNTGELHGIRALVAEAKGEAQIALTHWKRQISIEEKSDLFGQGAEARIHAATLAYAIEGEREAIALLDPLIARCSEQEERGLLHLASPHARAYLAAANWPPEFARRLHETDLQHYPSIAPANPEVDRTDGSTEASYGLDDLSLREVEVLDKLSAGESNKHIARELNISPFTVKRHVGNILNKLGVQSRGQAAAWYRSRKA